MHDVRNGSDEIAALREIQLIYRRGRVTRHRGEFFNTNFFRSGSAFYCPFGPFTQTSSFSLAGIALWDADNHDINARSDAQTFHSPKCGTIATLSLR